MLVLLAAAAVAAGKVTVTPTSTGYYRMGTNAAGGTVWGTRSEFVALWEGATGGSASQVISRTGALSSTTVGGLARSALKGGIWGVATSLAVEGIIQGAGWAINELKDQVTSPGSASTLSPGSWAYCAAPDGTLRCTTTEAGAVAIASIIFERCTGLNPNRLPSWSVQCRDGNDQLAFQEREIVTQMPDFGSGTQPTPIADAQLGDEVKKHPEVVTDLINDPRTGRPVMTPELVAQINDIRKQLEQQHGFDPGNDVAAPGDVADPDGDGDPATNPDQVSPWPSFCGWATTVCDWIGWTKEDPGTPSDAPVPWDESPPEPSSWTSGLGGGSCPAPASFTVSIGPVSASPTWDYTGICNMANLLRPLVIAIALAIAAYIVAGLRNNKGV
ncbi:hypothetical protein EA656_02515 [Pseudoxanthomonas winnipegensis]|uniref:Uncharacterized protein n=1 Tax=Pseudoxanthomonas winnipegensis TaxID=2480810 RepID=A0A4Q8LZY3_9GAMM|nr:virulence factor TspB C-terminal domain-related protein [Pseudoxanthomonas winnipegensis]TAA37560.1 hypothetical protein EA656_02515 [Pseudoxanthomonas winnipegensis]